MLSCDVNIFYCHFLPSLFLQKTWHAPFPPIYKYIRNGRRLDCPVAITAFKTKAVDRWPVNSYKRQLYQAICSWHAYMKVLDIGFKYKPAKTVLIPAYPNAGRRTPCNSPFNMCYTELKFRKKWSTIWSAKTSFGQKRYGSLYDDWSLERDL
jgi:hypothetical protein